MMRSGNTELPGDIGKMDRPDSLEWSLCEREEMRVSGMR